MQTHLIAGEKSYEQKEENERNYKKKKSYKPVTIFGQTLK